MGKSKQKTQTVFEMGTYEMRLLTLESASEGEVRLKKCLSAYTPKDFVVSTFIEAPIVNIDPIKKTAVSLIKAQKLSYENILLMLPDHSSILDLLVTPPRYSTKETQEAIKENIEPVMPLPFDDWFITHKSLGTWQDEEIILSIAIIKKNLLEAGSIIQSAGLNPVVVDVNILNIANLIEHYLTDRENKGKNICLINLGHESTSVAVFKDGNLRALQNRPIGSYDFTRQLAKHFNVSETDADQFKRNEIFFLPEASPEQDVQYNYTVIKNVFALLCREIFGAIENYLTKFREFSINEVIIAGGGANFENIKVALSTNLNTPVRCVSELYQLYVGGQSVSDPERNTLAAAAGCFLRE